MKRVKGIGKGNGDTLSQRNGSERYQSEAKNKTTIEPVSLDSLLGFPNVQNVIDGVLR